MALLKCNVVLRGGSEVQGGNCVSFGAVKARLYDAPGATKVTVAEEGRGTLAPSQWSNCKKLLL